MSVNIKIDPATTSLAILLLGSSCATAIRQPNDEVTRHSEANENQKILTALNTRMQMLESKLVSMNDKLEATKQALAHMTAQQKAESESKSGPISGPISGDDTEVIGPASAKSGTSVEAPNPLGDPEEGFVNDTAVQAYRKGMILFLGQKYPESVLTFSGFLEEFPDHPLAGSAQFYIGEAYIKQKEYKLALQEFQHVITSYDRSSHIADTLAEMTLAEEILKKSTEAENHRHLVTSLFPQSPAMALLNKPEVAKPPSRTGPAHTEPGHLEPAHAESIHAEPTHTEPAHAESIHAEPAHIEPTHADSVHTEPANEKSRREPSTTSPAVVPTADIPSSESE